MDALTRGQERNARFKRLLAGSEWDVIIARSGKNIAYLANAPLPGTLGRLQDFPDSPRYALVVWPRAGEPALIETRLPAELAKAQGLIADVRIYTEYVESALPLLVDMLHEKGLTRSGIGIEKGAFGAQQWEELCRLLPQATLKDCGSFLDHARAVKTPSEVAWLKEAADRMDQVYLDVFRSARVGETERELQNRMLKGLMDSGADGSHGIFQAVGEHYVLFKGEGEVRLVPGMILHTDHVAYFDGYAVNLSRNAVVGDPTSQQRQLYRHVLEVERAVIERDLRPGVRACDIYHACGRELAARGYRQTTPLVGHSIGLVYHQEPPILHPAETWIIEANTVIALEPAILPHPYHLQDEILIADAGPKLLSDLFETDELFVVG